MITRIVKVKLKKEHVDDFNMFMEKFAKDAREFTNNHHVDFFADMDEPSHYHIYTIWKTEGALSKFRNSEINREFKQKITDWSIKKYSAWTVENMR